MPVQRISTPLLLVVDALMARPGDTHYCYAVARKTGLAPGTVQPILSRLEGERWIEASWEAGHPRSLGRRPRRLYEITAVGERAMADLLVRQQRRLWGLRDVLAPGQA